MAPSLYPWWIQTQNTYFFVFHLLKHRLHGCSLICNFISFDAVTPSSLYSANREGYLKWIISKTPSKVERFQNDTVSLSCKQRNRIDLKMPVHIARKIINI